MRKDRILLITVGGSCTPIVTAIRSLEPQYIYFICSDDISGRKGSYNTITGEGKVCGTFQNLDQPNISIQCSLRSEQFEIVKLKEVDDYNTCYEDCSNKISEAFDKYPNAEIIVDYTGGTKSMTGGILLAASDFPEVIVSIVKGDRRNLTKVHDGTQKVVRARKKLPYLNKRIENVHQLINNYDYQSALRLIPDIFLITDLPEELESELDKLNTFCKCLNAWDVFNHYEALEIAKESNCLREDYKLQLQNVLNSRRCLEEGKPIPAKGNFSRYEVVSDLLNNAQRKAIQKKYDDAAARVYRATELLAQARLKFNYGIDTNNVPLSKVPKKNRKDWEDRVDNNGILKTSLLESYKILVMLDDELVTDTFNKNESSILAGLSVRNDSILAHGFTSVNEDRFNDIDTRLVKNFIHPIIKQLTKNTTIQIKQIPNKYAH